MTNKNKKDLKMGRNGLIGSRVEKLIRENTVVISIWIIRFVVVCVPRYYI